MLSVVDLKEKRGKMPPTPPVPPGSICGSFWLSFGCHFEPKGEVEGPLDVHLDVSMSHVAPSAPQIDFRIILDLSWRQV
jgi:hypothetical protein